MGVYRVKVFKTTTMQLALTLFIVYIMANEQCGRFDKK